MTKFVGLHGPTYVPREDLDAAVADVARLLKTAAVDPPSPLEKLALAILQSNGKLEQYNG